MTLVFKHMLIFKYWSAVHITEGGLIIRIKNTQIVHIKGKSYFTQKEKTLHLPKIH